MTQLDLHPSQVNYVKLPGPRQLVDGDVVSFGEMVLRFYRADAFSAMMRAVSAR